MTLSSQREELEYIGKGIVQASLTIHRALGPGLLESAYEECLAYELGIMGFEVEKQKAMPLVYKKINMGIGYRLDLLVDEKVIIEVKAVESLHEIHLAQLLTYLKLTDNQLGYLINFNVPLIKSGIKRVVNNLKP